MFPPRSLWPLILVLVVIVSCTSRAEQSEETTSSSTTSSPQTNTTQSTTTSTVPAAPGYLSYGPGGITRVVDGIPVRLVDEPVVKAVDDFMGGVVFTLDAEDSPWVDHPVYWLPAGATEPVAVAEASWSDFSVALLDGRPSLVHTDEDVRYGAVETGDLDTWHLLLTDLVSGHRRVLFHHSQWFEGGIDGVTGGGGRFVGEQSDVMSTWRIVVLDLDGQELELPDGVHPDPGPSAFRGCWRVCELTALLSPDGRDLVTWSWPEAEAPRDDQIAWWEQASKTPATVRITDLDSGEVWFETDVPAETMLGDFDGRFLALREVTRIPQESVTTDSTLIVDTDRELSDLRVPSAANLARTPIAPTGSGSGMDDHWTAILASISTGGDPLEISAAYEDARSRKEQFHAEFDLETSLLLSDDYVTLNQGYWVVHTGAFATRDEAAARCEELRPLVGPCYPRYIATPCSIDPTVDQSAVGQWDEVSVSLQPGQYAAIDFTDPNDALNGLQREDGSRIGVMDDPSSFLLPEHGEADLLWIGGGMIVWRFPNPLPADGQPRFLRFDVEVSSEAPQARAPHPSEITVAVNGAEIGRWVIPADPDASYGNPDDPQVARQRNHLAPWRSQFGWLTHWTVDGSGSWFGYDFRLGDAPPSRVSSVAIDDLGLAEDEDIEVAVTVRDATVDGIRGFGLNVYGSTWGDYSVDPTVTVAYSTAGPASPPVAPKLGVMTNLAAVAGRAGDLGVCSHMPGRRLAEDGTWHPAIWVNGELIYVGLPTDQATSAYLSDVNTHGQAVGYFGLEDGARAFLWEAGQWTELWLDGATGTSAAVINNSGQVVVDSHGPDGRWTYVWQDGDFTLIGADLYPTDINELGQVTGFVYTAEGTRAFLWSEGALTQLGTLGGRDSSGWGLGDDGSVVGSADTAAGDPHAFWWKDGMMTDLGTLGGPSSKAHAVNSLGQVVGMSSSDATDLDVRAFLWEDGTMYNLGSLGGNWSSASCIDDSGVVTGMSDRSDVKGSWPFVWRR